MEPDTSATPTDPLARLSASARGWHTIQLAVLGFIGICGVLRSDSTAPKAVQWTGAVLAVAALAVAVTAVFMVGRVAWPLSERPGIDPRQRLAAAGASMTTGVRLTVVALILIVVATLLGWWPSNTAATAVDPAPMMGSLGPVLRGALGL
jgi:hypothetical protein